MWSAVFLTFFYHCVEKMRNPCVKDIYKLKKLSTAYSGSIAGEIWDMQGYKTQKGGTKLC